MRLSKDQKITENSITQLQKDYKKETISALVNLAKV